jgi:hypothetical protein
MKGNQWRFKARKLMVDNFCIMKIYYFQKILNICSSKIM